MVTDAVRQEQAKRITECILSRSSDKNERECDFGCKRAAVQGLACFCRKSKATLILFIIKMIIEKEGELQKLQRSQRESNKLNRAVPQRSDGRRHLSEFRGSFSIQALRLP